MLDTRHIHPLTEFLRNHKAFIAALKENKKPEVLTVKGKAELVVMDVETYQAMADQVEEVLRITALQEALAAADRGELTDLDQAITKIKAKHGLSD